MQQEKAAKKPSRIGKLFKTVVHALCYVGLFLVVQSAVFGLYSGYLSASYAAYGQDMYEIYDTVLNEVYEHLSLLTLISGVLTILLLALLFALRHKHFWQECRLNPVSPKALCLCALIGTALNIVISVTISLLPLPESWFLGLEEQYQYLGESNIVLELLSTAVVTGLLEEMIFRGLVETRLRRGLPVWVSMLGSALIFGACHGTPIAIGYAFALGILFSFLDKRYDSILPSVITHMFFNACALWFVTEDTLLIMAAYLISLGVLIGGMFFYFRRPVAEVGAETEDAEPDEPIPTNAADPADVVAPTCVSTDMPPDTSMEMPADTSTVDAPTDPAEPMSTEDTEHKNDA